MSVRENQCEITCFHEDVVEEVRKKLIGEEKSALLAEVFKAMGDPTRIKIINALYEAELCVCDIAYLLGMSQSAISHQLRVLRALKLIKNRKEGKIVYYSLDDHHIISLFRQGLDHIEHRHG